MTRRVVAGIATALALSASIAAASDYSDFRIPSHSTSRLDLSITGSFSPSRNNRGGYQRENESGQANASGSWASGYDSERLQYGLLVLGSGRGGIFREKVRVDFPDPFPLQRASDREDRFVQELWSLQGSAQNYPTTAAWSVGAGVAGDARYSQEWISIQEEESNPPIGTRSSHDDEIWTYQYVVDASAFTGWGRVRNATGIQQVQFTEDRLIRDGVLGGPLQQQTRQSLAELFYLRTGFQVVHDQPDRFFWSEFERILRTDPALRAETFNTYAVMHAGDRVLVAPALDRQVGAFLGPLVTFRHTNYTRRSDHSILSQQFSNDTLVSESGGSFSDHVEQDDQRALGGLQATVEQPLSEQWHLSLFAVAQADLRGIDEFAELRSGMSLRYWGGERWYAEARANHSRTKVDDANYNSFQPRWFVSYGGTVNYYLEDHVSIEVGISQSQSTNALEFIRTGVATVGLSYRRGTLTAPGLVGKVRPAGS